MRSLRFRNHGSRLFLVAATWASFGRPSLFQPCGFVRGWSPLTRRDRWASSIRRSAASGSDPEARPKVAFLLGGPGSGKGTQADQIAQEFDWVFLSAGELLRAERSREGSELGALIDDVINSGRVVPSDVIAKLLEQAMREAGWASRKFLIDGYPRSLDQFQGWKDVLDPQVRFLFCLLLEVSEEEQIRRVLARGKTSGRSDDNLETVQKRLATNEKETGPVVAELEASGFLRRVNGERPVEEVWADVKRLFDGI